MKDQAKTKEQLIVELKELRRRISKLKKSATISKHIEERFKKSEEKYRLLVETSTDMIFTVDVNGNFLFVNKAFKKNLGYSIEEMKRINGFKLVHPEDLPTVEKQFGQLLKGKSADNMEYRYKAKDGSYIHILNNATPIFDSKGNVVSAFGVARDISQRKRMEDDLRKAHDELERRVKMRTHELLAANEQLKKEITEHKRDEEEKKRLQAQLIQSEKMAGIGTLTSGIAHEFNNLLQIMSGHTEFAQRTKKLEDMEEALDIVANTSNRASKIIKDLLTFSRREPHERNLCNIAELVEFVLSMTEEQLKKHNIKVVREYGRVPKIEVNKGEIQQVFLNMVTNARDAMIPKGGRLVIEVKKVNGNVEVSFTDTGIGIEEENLGRVFEPFYSTKGAVGGDSKPQSIGLGLSVSYGIVERHGGAIEVESEAGRGTTFTMKLPVKRKEVKKGRVKVARKAKRKKLKPQKILVVDDEKAICQMFTKCLSSVGHRVKSSFTGRKAISMVKQESFDVVFLDIIMPWTSGAEVLEKIKEISPQTRVVMITGSLMKEDIWDELKKKGASGYIQKPFKIENITKCLETLGLETLGE